MSRHEESIGRMPNPSQFYLEWDSRQNSFCYYASDSKEVKPFPLPFRFLALKFMNTIVGFDEDRQQGIYANEVQDTRKEHFRVNYRDGSHLATGLYADIKDEVNRYGGKFAKSIYAMTEKGMLINIKLKGGQMVNFGAIEKYGNRWQDEWIEVKNFEEKIYGENKQYTVPVFNFGGTLLPTENVKADKAYEMVKAYFQSKPVNLGSPPRTAPAPARQAAIPATAPAAFLTNGGDDDDLPF
ncbi:hypothetical protein [Dyadobacter sp. CY343]|uniref:hypothetical protein n=1 Tax=Dyadobacter sp. CY343 TaxID=2907299 RepID=UPI001F2CCBE6|nr:hypothetical protein [Dyadobacter sp. CY343]MCE7061231.1 hypothetical protein [Dyadobacter sp. CY343]